MVDFLWKNARWLAAAFALTIFSTQSTTLFGAAPPEVHGLANLGSIRALVFSMAVFASAAGPGVTGYLIDTGVDYPAQPIVMGLYRLPVSILLWLVARQVGSVRIGAK